MFCQPKCGTNWTNGRNTDRNRVHRQTFTQGKDEHGEWILEPGALVLANGGICVINDFNLMHQCNKTPILKALYAFYISWMTLIYFLRKWSPIRTLISDFDRRAFSKKIYQNHSALFADENKDWIIFIHMLQMLNWMCAEREREKWKVWAAVTIAYSNTKDKFTNLIIDNGQ